MSNKLMKNEVEIWGKKIVLTPPQLALYAMLMFVYMLSYISLFIVAVFHTLNQYIGYGNGNTLMAIIMLYVASFWILKNKKLHKQIALLLIYIIFLPVNILVLNWLFNYSDWSLYTVVYLSVCIICKLVGKIFVIKSQGNAYQLKVKE